MLSKKCSKCFTEKTLDQFWGQLKGKFGKEASCKSCGRARFREWSSKNIGRRKLYKRLHRSKNIKSVLRREGKYRATHKDQARARWRKYKKVNSEKISDTQRKYYVRNRDRCVEKCRRWAVENPDKARAADRLWRLKNVESARARLKERRAKINGATICDFTAADWSEIKKLHGYRCAYCGKTPKTLTQDHVIPISSSGNHTWSNILPSCQSCNSRKRDKFFLEYGVVGGHT